MKNNKEILTDFESVEMDTILYRWLIDGIAPSERESFEKTLVYNRRFREHFCEWLKAIREPAWALTYQQNKDKK